jgi:preprotein translocase subunit SecA
MVFNWILEKIAWTYNERQLAKYAPKIDKINKLYEEYDKLSDEELKQKSLEFRERLKNWESLDDILEEAFAVHKQACKRLVWTEYEVKWQKVTWNMIPYDVQLLWWMVLHDGKIAEMKTWEGKTLVATLAAYLNALEWKGVHLVTVNDYLAERDAQIMKPLYDFLGVSVGSVSKNVPIEKRRAEYEKDITYVENSELWFDYLRDNLAQSMDQRLLLFRPLNYAIVDEADSIMIDEARTPLIISQPSWEPTEKYKFYADIVKALIPCPLETERKKSWLFDDGKKEELDCDYKIDPKAKTALLTSKGIAKLEKLLGVENLYRDLGYEEIHHIENALKAKACYERDKDYLVHNGEVLIIDENTGRAMPGRRYSEGLHQAIEAKEWVEIKQESETVATITYQNFLKLYKKLAWMTGTAATEWEEFEKIYWLEVLVIPTNKPVIRVDKQDKVFFDQDIKFKNIVDTVKFYHKMWVPFLLWTSSVQTSEILSRYLRQAGLQHSVLNAKYHEMEAKIVANAGKLGSIIVATNMAWRWTDIKLEPGLFDKVSENYTKWIFDELNKDKWLSLVIYSEFETGKLFEKLVNKLPSTVYFYSKKEGKKQVAKEELIKFLNDSIKEKIDFTVEADNFYLEAKFNKSKKLKDHPFVQLIIKKSAKDEPELVEKDIHMWLYVLASEKHESRRIDNQLRGRSWRQWDPGVSQFYVALDDDLMIKSGWLITKTLASKMYPREELEKMAIENKMITNSIERAQKQMEAMMFSIRKNLFEYDSVLNKQREVIYGLRDKLLTDENVDEIVEKYIEDIIKSAVEKYEYNKDMLIEYLKEVSGIDFSEEVEKYKWKDLEDYLILKFKDLLKEKKEQLWEEKFKYVQKQIMLSVLDRLWMKHIDEIMYLRDKVSMYGYAQIDPLLQYKKEAFEKYQLLMWNIKTEVISNLLKLNPDQFQTQTQVIQLWENTDELIKKLKQAWQVAKDIAPSIEEKKQTWPKILEKNDEFEVIELDDSTDNSSSDKEAEELIRKMLGK